MRVPLPKDVLECCFFMDTIIHDLVSKYRSYTPILVHLKIGFLVLSTITLLENKLILSSRLDFFLIQRYRVLGWTRTSSKILVKISFIMSRPIEMKTLPIFQCFS